MADMISFINMMQFSGLAVFVLGFLIAWTYLPGIGNGSPTGGDIGRGHQIVGSLVMGLAITQVC